MFCREEEPDFHLDIQEDVKEECEAKFGQVQIVVADKVNPNGLVYLKFDSVDNAVKVSCDRMWSVLAMGVM